MTHSERECVLNEAAQVICPKCALHHPVEYQSDPTPAWWHEASRCEASGIHNLKFYKSEDNHD